MSEFSLDHLTRIDPRTAWESEPSDFTPWLADDQNFQVLADTLHFTDAEVEATEHSIGSFSADIVARDRDGYILIENQLEQTDHVHLGQILTYLAGLDGPVKVVWIATKVREEHRAAIDWLNEQTGEDYSFFAVELELVRIASSPAAPLFHVVAKPNEWTRHISKRSKQLSSTALTDRQRRYQEFWGAVADFMDEQDSKFRRSTPPKDHWWQFPTGRSYFSFTLSAGGRDHYIGVELYIHNDPDKLYFGQLLNDQDEIDDEFGPGLEWERLDDKKGSRIVIRRHRVDPMDAANHADIIPWYWEQLQKFHKVFGDRVRRLDTEGASEPDAEDSVRVASHD